MASPTSGMRVALLLVCCGRLAALPNCPGDGIAVLNARLVAP
jgi:hypothetical protein